MFAPKSRWRTAAGGNNDTQEAQSAMQVEQFFIAETETILGAMQKLDETGERILFVAPDGVLKAALTDGDIRKCILRGMPLETAITEAANYSPKRLSITERGHAKQYMDQHAIDALPLVDKEGRVVDIIFASGADVKNDACNDIPVVIMAGGVGSRLYPYTKILPKPLIPIGERPILEHIIGRFCDFGCNDFRLVVNYKKGMIKSYFNDLEKDYSVSYLDEDIPLGTGGGLCLLKGQLNGTFFLSNCDILLDIDFADLAAYHKRQNNLITMVCAAKHFVVPYGVIELGENGSIQSMKEKPEMNFWTNTGLYVVESSVVEALEDNKRQHFTDIIQHYQTNGGRVGVYPISEQSWMDMGQMEELENMRRKLEQQ